VVLLTESKEYFKTIERQAVGYSTSKKQIILIRKFTIHYPKDQRFWIDSRDYWSFTGIDTHGSDESNYVLFNLKMR
jgi:hypothetical protein